MTGDNGKQEGKVTICVAKSNICAHQPFPGRLCSSLKLPRVPLGSLYCKSWWGRKHSSSSSKDVWSTFRQQRPSRKGCRGRSAASFQPPAALVLQPSSQLWTWGGDQDHQAIARTILANFHIVKIGWGEVCCSSCLPDGGFTIAVVNRIIVEGQPWHLQKLKRMGDTPQRKSNVDWVCSESMGYWVFVGKKRTWTWGSRRLA